MTYATSSQHLEDCVAAARIALARYGVSAEPELIGWSMAACFVAGDLFVRVNDPDLDAQRVQETLDASRLLADCGVVTIEALDDPVTISGRPIEIYRRIRPLPLQPTPAELGTELARFHHATRDRGTPGQCRRLTAVQARLTAVADRVDPGLWRLAAASLDDLVTAVDSSPGPHGLIHGDAHELNMLHDGRRWVWVDLEYVGHGPLALDVAYTTGELRRFGTPERAALFLDAYRAAGGPGHLVDESLEHCRDVIGVADAVSLMWRSAHVASCARQRANSLDDPNLRWDALAEP